jgi:hypothetical protein
MGQATPLTDKTNLRGSVLIGSEVILGLPDYEATGIEEAAGQSRTSLEDGARPFSTKTAR